MYDDFGGSDICMVFLFGGKERVGFSRKVGKGCPLILIFLVFSIFFFLHVPLHVKWKFGFVKATRCYAFG